jgi:hypothetical protein
MVEEEDAAAAWSLAAAAVATSDAAAGAAASETGGPAVGKAAMNREVCWRAWAGSGATAGGRTGGTETCRRREAEAERTAAATIRPAAAAIKMTRRDTAAMVV